MSAALIIPMITAFIGAVFGFLFGVNQITESDSFYRIIVATGCYTVGIAAYGFVIGLLIKGSLYLVKYFY